MYCIKKKKIIKKDLINTLLEHYSVQKTNICALRSDKLVFGSFDYIKKILYNL